MPKHIIVGCSQDRNHAHDHVVGLAQPADETLQAGRDYMQLLNPGAYPTGLDELADLCIRFDLPPITVITHADCGVIVTLRQLAKDPQLDVSDPRILFGNAANEITQHFEKHGVTKSQICEMDDEQIAATLAKLVAFRIAEHFEGRAREVDDFPQDDVVTKRIANLPLSKINAAYAPQPDVDIVEVIPRTSVREVATFVAPGGFTL